MSKVTIHVDGGARGNPGPAAGGVEIRDQSTGEPVHEAGYYLGRMTNNVAEYKALVLALQHAVRLGVQDAQVFTDSQLMARQLTGEYRVKSPLLKPFHEQAQALLGQVPAWRIHHIPREQNRRADQLANMAMDAKDDVVITGEGGDNDEQPAPPGRLPEPAAVRCWEVCFTSPAGPQCPVGHHVGQKFRFGPITPSGMCVEAAVAAMPDRRPEPEAGAGPSKAACPRCDAGLRIDPA